MKDGSKKFYFFELSFFTDNYYQKNACLNILLFFKSPEFLYDKIQRYCYEEIDDRRNIFRYSQNIHPEVKQDFTQK